MIVDPLTLSTVNATLSKYSCTTLPAAVPSPVTRSVITPPSTILPLISDALVTWIVSASVSFTKSTYSKLLTLALPIVVTAPNTILFATTR